MFPATDALSTALEQLRLRCSLLGEPGCTPWRREFLRDAISIHLLLRGGCVLDVDFPVPRFRVSEDELVVANRGVPGALQASGAEPPSVLSARVHLEAPGGHPLLTSFPPLIRTYAAPPPDPSASTLQALREELSRPRLGWRSVASHLLAGLFVQVLRAHVDRQAWNDRGFFRMLADPLLREQLEAAGRPGASATSVARTVERTRQRTGARIAKFGGTSVRKLLRGSRLRRAAELMRSGESDLARIAREAGYGTRQALGRALQEELGLSPTALWRTLHGQPFPRKRPRQ